MKKNQAISRIERVLKKIASSDFNDSDIEVLFITARELPLATKSIREVGSFVAHIYERDQGIMKDIMLRNYLRLNFGFGVDKHDVKPEKNEYPQYLPLLIKLQLQVFEDDYFKKKFDLKGGQVRAARASLIDKKSYEMVGGLCKLKETLGEKECLIASEVLSVINCADGIYFHKLMDELMALLGKHIADVERIFTEKNKCAILCVLLCLMNNVVFVLQPGVSAKTIIGVNEDGFVNIGGQYGIISEKGKDAIVKAQHPLFMTTYLVSQIFSPEVSIADIESGNIEFSMQLGKIKKQVI